MILLFLGGASTVQWTEFKLECFYGECDANEVISVMNLLLTTVSGKTFC